MSPHGDVSLIDLSHCGGARQGDRSDTSLGDSADHACEGDWSDTFLGNPADPAPTPPTRQQYRRNVCRIFTANFFAMSAGAIALGPLFDAYLLNLGKASGRGNVLVGTVESARGIIELALSYPIGALSDRISRVRLLSYNLPIWTAGLCVAIIGILSGRVFLIYVGIILWAPCSKCSMVTNQVLVADYSPPETRTKTISNMASLQLLSRSIGPLLQVGILLCLGKNHWNNSLLRWVTSAGCLLWPGVVVLTCRLADLQPLEKTVSQGRGTIFCEQDLSHRICGLARRWWLAATFEFISFVIAVGAGMTVKFFPLFFRVDYQFTPLQVCVLAFAYPVSIAAMVQVCRRVSGYIGRLSAILAFHFLGTACLWSMCYFRSLFVVLPLFLLRGALMNARTPVVRTVIYDLVPAETKGRWNSIQSISSFTWSGSAALGGYIADAAGDYRVTFMVTATIYTFAFLLVVPLVLIYPEERRVIASSVQANQRA